MNDNSRRKRKLRESTQRLTSERQNTDKRKKPQQVQMSLSGNEHQDADKKTEKLLKEYFEMKQLHPTAIQSNFRMKILFVFFFFIIINVLYYEKRQK